MSRDSLAGLDLDVDIIIAGQLIYEYLQVGIHKLFARRLEESQLAAQLGLDSLQTTGTFCFCTSSSEVLCRRESFTLTLTVAFFPSSVFTFSRTRLQTKHVAGN